jgi:hypothetical protein
MTLEPHDLHLDFEAGAGRLAVWNASHQPVMHCEARNRTTNDGQFGHWGNIPSGLYLLGTPVAKNTAPFGPFFIPVLDCGTVHVLAEHGRAGIGIHGGGSGLPDPLADRQSPPWVPTLGCIRMINRDLVEIVNLIKACQAKGGKAYLTVVSRQPGAESNATAIDLDDYLNVSADQLDPGE